MLRGLFSRVNKNKDSKDHAFLKLLIPPLFTLFILVALFSHFKITPFGNNTLAVMDADIQYVDYFNYYKGVLDGKNTLGYTFSKELGGNFFGSFSYYLASPINLLLKFFPENKIELFFTLSVTIRLALASLTFYLFLKGRVNKNPSRGTYLLFLVLSLFYALSSYSLQQASNLMWLDGVWLLPLMMLGVSKIFDKKNIKLFIISSACAIIFNWYSGFLALLFCAFWFFVECILRSLDQKNDFKNFIKFFWQNGWRLLVSTILALLISGIILMPAFKALGEGSRGGGIDLAFLHFDLRGKVLDTLSNYYPGTNSDPGMMSLFIGAFSILTIFSVFISKEVKRSHKIAYFAIILTLLLIFYFNPIYFVFSLLKDVGSYWIRFSFGCFAILLFLCAYIPKSEKISPTCYILSGILFLSSGLIFDYIDTPVRLRFYYGIFVVAFSVILYYCHTAKTQRTKAIFIMIAFILSIAEVATNAYLVMKKFSGAETFTNYTISQGDTIQRIRTADESPYRIHNLSQRCSFCLNDALSHNYYSIDGYTSSPDDKQIDLLHSLGYKRWFYQSNITDDSILSTDSLLGVKYFTNESTIESNPYALPMVFSTPNTTSENFSNNTYDENTFDFQNKLYSELSGIHENLYKKVNFVRETDDSEITYHLDYNPSDDYILYGEIAADDNYCVTLLDGENVKSSWYLSHTAPSVVKLDSSTVTIEVEDEDSKFTIENIKSEHFYYLDLSVFKKMTEKIKNENSVSNLAIDNENVSFTVNTNKPQMIFTSIHNQSGWSITVNDKEVKPTLLSNSLILLNLEPGQNEMELKFTLPGFKLGVLLSVIGVISTIAFCLINKKL